MSKDALRDLIVFDLAKYFRDRGVPEKEAGRRAQQIIADAEKFIGPNSPQEADRRIIRDRSEP